MKSGIAIISSVIGIVGGFIATAFGGWSASLTTLLIFMTIDYITGLMVAGIFNKSKKTSTGAIESKTCWKGLCRKGVTLLVVLVACRLDILIDTTYLRDATVIAFVVNECISIIENAGLMGVPIPSVITKAIHVLKEKSDMDEDETEK